MNIYETIALYAGTIFIIIAASVIAPVTRQFKY